MPSPGQKLLQKFIPATIGGWNVRDPLWEMDINDARVLDNIVPGTGSCRLRGGVQQYIDLTGENVDCLAEYVTSAGTKKFLAIRASTFDDITVAGAPVNRTPATYSAASPPWITTNFGGYFYASNLLQGKAFYWDGAAALGVTVNTTAGPVAADLAYVTAYKSRLYFTERNTPHLYYADLNQLINLSLTLFDFSTLFQKGGTLLAIGSTTKATGNVTDELFVAVSSEGEILVYQGTYPGDSTWSIVARYFVARPVSGRCLFYISADLTVLTWQGPITMSSLLAGTDVDNQYTVVAGKVTKAFIDAAYLQATDPRWGGCYFNKAPYVIINVPILVASSVIHQYVMNTITKAWCRFTGWVAMSNFVVYNNALYYGSMAGKVYQADVLNATDAASATIPAVMWNHYDSLDMDNRIKTFTFVQPIFTALDSSGSDSTLAYNERLNVDFQETDNNLNTATMGIGGTTAILNNPKIGIMGGGQWAGIGFEASFPKGADVRFFGTNLYGELGGV